MADFVNDSWVRYRRSSHDSRLDVGQVAHQDGFCDEDDESVSRDLELGSEVNSPPQLSSPSDGSWNDVALHPFASKRTNSDHPEKASVPAQRPSSAASQALADRLARLSRRIAATSPAEQAYDELALTEQINALEMMFLGLRSPSIAASPQQTEPQPVQPSLPARPTTMTDGPLQSDITRAPGVVDETAAQLSTDLSTLFINLKARYEETTHIHTILISRLERAAQRILYLQRYCDTLEAQLSSRDDELANIRVLLKALELQVPDHPDAELRRCLNKVRAEYRELRRRRAAESAANREMWQSQGAKSGEAA